MATRTDVDVSEEPDPGTSAGRIVKRLVVGCATVLALSCLSMCGGCWMWSRTQRRVVDEELARLEEAGLAPDWDQILGPEPDRNGADAVNRVFEAVGDLWERDEQEATAVDGMAAGLTDPEGYEEQFGPGGWNDPALIDEKLPGVLARLASSESSLEEALAADGWRFDTSWGEVPFPEVPHLMQVRELGSILIARASHASAEGRLDDAWDDLIRYARLAELLDDPSLIGFLVRKAMTGVLVDATEQLLARGLPSDEQADRLGAHLERLERATEEGYARALRTELATALLIFDGLIGDRDLDEETRRSLSAEGLTTQVPIFSRLLLADRRAYVTILGRAIRATAAGGDLATAERALGEIDDEVEQLGVMTPITRLLLPALFASHRKRYQGLAELRLARAGLAFALAGRDANLPSRPGEVTTIEIARDPFSRLAEPLRYQRIDERRALLWSVGEDGDDDRGREPDFDAIDDEDGDIVFEIELKPLD